MSKLRKAFTNTFSANMKLSETQLHKIGKSGRFLGRLLGSLLKNWLHLTKDVLKALAKSLLISLGLTTAASATDVAIHKKMFGKGTKTLTISNEEMNDINRIVKYPEKSALLVKGVGETIKWSKRTKRRISWNVIRHFRC